MPQTIPTIEKNSLVYHQDGLDQRILVGTPDWYAWLATATTFRFRNEHAIFTARRERASNRRGGWYWKAYSFQGGKRHRVYLGRAEDLTLDHLNAAAQTFAQTPLPAVSSRVSPPTSPAHI